MFRSEEKKLCQSPEYGFRLHPQKSALAAEPKTADFQRKTSGVNCDGFEVCRNNIATNGNGLPEVLPPQELQIYNFWGVNSKLRRAQG